MGKKLILSLLIVVALGLGVAFWLFQTPAPEPEAVVVARLPAASGRDTAADTGRAAPDCGRRRSAEQVPLPDLEQSDPLYGQALAKLFGEKTLSRYFYSDRMIRRFVATVDNLSRHDAPANMMPVKPVGGAFLVDRQAAEMSISPANAQRYAGYLAVMTAVEPRRLVDLYVSFYPLFQRAYRELGYPDGFFNDRLFEAIDSLLKTPEVAPPIALAQPKVLYTYADESLQACSAGQRIMLRLGADNRARAIKVLIAIRNELLGRSPARQS
jgi:hypothetical protein